MTSKIRFTALVVTLGLVASGCSTLKEKDPFRVSVSYDLDQSNTVVVTPPEITVDGRFGYVAVANNTEKMMNFDIDDLAVYESILPGRTKEVLVDEAVDGRSYEFYDHKNPGIIEGLLIVRFREDR